MTVYRPPQTTVRSLGARTTRVAPPRLVEYVFLATIFYGIAGDAFGISVPLLGAGMLALLATYSLVRVGPNRIALFQPVAYAIACAASHIALQTIVHGEDVFHGYVRPFVTWIPTLVVTQWLSLREGFLRRFAVAMFIMGCVLLPFLQFEVMATGRVGLDPALAISNPNALAAWFGFCAVYFVILGVETRLTAVRAVAWVAAAGCLAIVGLTVSRGALLAIALASAVALRRLLRRGFVPVLLVIVLACVAAGLQLFERSAASYAARATEETGRLLVWPVVLVRVLQAPIAGVGASNIATELGAFDRPVTPHNSFLFIALASGILPLAFFIAYWRSAIKRTLHAGASVDAPFRLGLIIYCFLIAQTTNMPFTSPWMIATLCADPRMLKAKGIRRRLSIRPRTHLSLARRPLSRVRSPTRGTLPAGT